MRRRWPLSFLIAIGIITLSYNACISSNPVIFINRGTETTNPMAPLTNQLMFAVCNVLSRCNPQLSTGKCQAGISSSSGFSAPLGLPASFDTLSSIAYGEQSNVLVGNSSQGNSCYSSITSMSCSDPVVQSAYQSTAADPFSGSVNLVSGQSCGNVLTPVTRYSCSTRVFLRGISNPVLSVTLSSSGITYSINPPLPAGLNLNSATGAISGTPTAVTPLTTYTVTGTSASGTTTSTVKIRTADGYVVDDLNDLGNTGGANCFSSSGTCTLRAAVEAAASKGSVMVIVLPAGNINLSLARPINVASAAEIYGDCALGTTVDGMGMTGVLSITAGPTVLDHLTVQNGSLTDSPGAGISIDSQTATFNTTLRNLVVQNNVINGGATFPEGAGIAISGASSSAQAIVTLTDSVISHNNNNASGGHFGGGLSAWSNTQVTITNTTFSDNFANSGGGAIASRGSVLKVTESLFYNNSCGSSGEGAAFVYNYQAGGSATFTNNSFVSNHAGVGGVFYHAGSGPLNILNCTLANNSSSDPNYGGAIAGMNPGAAFIQNTIFSNNTSAGSLVHCKGSGVMVTSQGYNLSDAGASDCALTSTGDRVSTAAALAPLQDNGGPTQTIALLSTSPAIDQANAAACPAIDQRGVARLSDGKCDIGAFETK